MQISLASYALSFVAIMAMIASPSKATEVSLHKDEPIARVRARLIMDGWTPVRIDQKTGGERENLMANARIFFEAGYFEVESCSGTGLNYCILNYQKNGQCLRIVTQGEEDPTVRNWTDACPE